MKFPAPHVIVFSTAEHAKALGQPRQTRREKPREEYGKGLFYQTGNQSGSGFAQHLGGSATALFSCQPLVSLFSNGQADSLSTRQRDPRLVTLKFEREIR